MINNLNMLKRLESIDTSQMEKENWKSRNDSSNRE